MKRYWIFRIVYCICGSLYGYGLFWIGVVSGGAGHGFLGLYEIAAYPFGYGFVMWPVLGLLVYDIDKIDWVKVSAIVLIVAQYLGILWGVFTVGLDVSGLRKIWTSSPILICFGCIYYLIGQLYIWSRLSKAVEPRGHV